VDIQSEIEIEPVITAPERMETPVVIAVEPRCPKCTGPMVRCAVGYVGIYGWWLERVTRPAGTLGPPRTSTSDLVADTCIRCGYTEFFAKDPAALLAGDEKN
jgi:hypothetical protein